MLVTVFFIPLLVCHLCRNTLISRPGLLHSSVQCGKTYNYLCLIIWSIGRDKGKHSIFESQNRICTMFRWACYSWFAADCTFPSGTRTSLHKTNCVCAFLMGEGSSEWSWENPRDPPYARVPEFNSQMSLKNKSSIVPAFWIGLIRYFSLIHIPHFWLPTHDYMISRKSRRDADTVKIKQNIRVGTEDVLLFLKVLLKVNSVTEQAVTVQWMGNKCAFFGFVVHCLNSIFPLSLAIWIIV